MALRVGFLSVAHMHAWGYAPAFKSHPDVSVVGLWDDDAERRGRFANEFEIREFADPETLVGEVDAVVITSENRTHAQWIELAAGAGKAILCEKPLCTTQDEADRIGRAAAGSSAPIMTAFPCRYSPAFRSLQAKVKAGDLGTIRGICATNRGRCPWGWFTDPSKSGGGAMIDHVVHVADLLDVLLGEPPSRVQAQIGNNMYGQEWDDTAMLTLEFASGAFATLDSSWSRHASYKTWGDVTMNVVGDQGLVELELFSQAIDRWGDGPMSHRLAGYGSDLDAGLVLDFVRCAIDGSPAPIGIDAGLKASRIAIAGYASAKLGQPVDLAAA